MICASALMSLLILTLTELTAGEVGFEPDLCCSIRRPGRVERPEGGGFLNLHPCDSAFAEVMRLQQVVDFRSPRARRFGSKVRTNRRARERRDRPETSNFIGNFGGAARI
jgi:hypothetical protein